MAIENTYLLGKNITLGCGFDLQAKAPLDSRQTVPAFAGLQALINYDAAYEGMIVYDEETKKTYQAQKCDSYTVVVDDKEKTYDIEFREFGINESELKDLIASETTAAMEFKGAATALPENASKGDMYKVTAAFKIGEEDVKVGDSIVYDGEQWFIIPSGDDIEDTWRPVTDVDNDSTLTFAAGDKLDVTVDSNGTITYSHEEIAAPVSQNADDDEPTRTYITQLIADNHGHIIGFKTATEVVEDTNTTYEFEGLPVGEDEAAPSSVYFQVKSSDADAAEVIYLDAYTKNEADAELAKRVDKVEGYSLVADDEIARLAEVDNYDDEEVRGLISGNAKAIEDLDKYVGTIPNVPDADGNNKYADLDVIGYINKKAQETLAAASGNSSETAASVKAQLDDYIGENNTRVKAVEDDIAAIKDADNGILKQAQDYADGLAGNYDEAGAAAGVKSELETEIAKKADAVEGKSLVADDEITKLAGVSAGANKVEASENGKIKIDGVDTVVYTHPEKHAIAEVDGLHDALNGLQAKGDYAAEEHTHTVADITDYATDVDAKIKAITNPIGEVVSGHTEWIAGHDEVAHLTDEEVKGWIKEAVDPVDQTADANAEAIEDLNGRLGTLSNKVQDIDSNYVNPDEAEEIATTIANAAIEQHNADAEHLATSEVNGLIDTKLTPYDTADVAAGKFVAKATYDAFTEQYADDKESLQNQINLIMNNPDTKDVIDSIAEFTDYINTHGTIADGFRTDIDKNKEDIAANAKAIADHEALATETYETKDDAAAKLAEAKEYTDAAADAVMGTADDASSANTVLGAKKYADEKAAAAIADAAGKYETKGTAQGIVDALKLAETYEPIGAESRAIAAAKTETETQVNALAGEGNTSTVKKNADDIASLFDQLQWGEF